MKQQDWGRFTKKIPVNAKQEEIYKAWTVSSEIEKWFLRDAAFKKSNDEPRSKNDFIQKGDTYEWKWYGYDDSVFERGEILEANGKDFIKFIFGKAGIVSVSIKPVETATIVELTQDEIPTDEQSKINYFVGCGEGWTFYLANLKSILEGGIDLRNKDLNLTKVISS